MSVINTNVKALFSQAAMKGTDRALSTAMNQLSTGKRVNSAKDDAAGMAIATRMTQQIRSLNMAIRNAGDATSLIQTAEGGTVAINDMMQRMRELAIQAITDTNSSDQRDYLDLEFQQLKQEINRTSKMVEWNGFSILDGSVGQRVGERPVYKITSSGEYHPTVDDGSGNPVVDNLETGDLIVNGITINPSFAKDDTVSPRTNAGGSAIAISAAINRLTKETGVVAVPNDNVMNGVPVVKDPTPGGSKGFVVINGWKTPEVTSVKDNVRESRAAMVASINEISAKTGVKAIDTNDDTRGITLEAIDGRNIEVQLFGDHTNASGESYFGIRGGVQVSTYSLEAKVEANVKLTSQLGKDITRSRLPVGDYTQNVAKMVTTSRPVANTAAEIIPMNEGDLRINGTPIPASASVDDPYSHYSTTSTPSASAIAIAAAINSKSAETGVNARAIGPVIQGAGDSTSDPTSLTSEPNSSIIYVNGQSITINYGDKAVTPIVEPSYQLDFSATKIPLEVTAPDSYAAPGDRVKFLKDALNRVLSDSNIDVSMTTGNRLSFTTSDGRNLSVGVVNDSSADLSDPNELGLDGITVVTTTGVEATDQALLDGIPTAYGRVELAAQSPHFNDPELFGSSPVLAPISGGPGHPPHDRFTIETGASGVTGNFEGLGFTPGTFGGEVTDADSKMQPPKTGRLFFQVGSSANQTITIDLADFGKNGPITSRITSDVDDKVKTIRINTPEGANAVLDALDEAMDKVNATRATMGAVMNRLTYVTDTLTSVSINSSASRSQIEDADYASASTELAKTQIMQQAATAVLAQANMSQQTVLKLLQG